MKYESPAAGEEKIYAMHVNRLDAYSYGKLTDKSSQPGKPINPEKKCYRCGTRFTVKQMKQCRAINAKYSNYEKIGYFAKVCQQKEINNIEKMSTIPVKRKEIPTS